MEESSEYLRPSEVEALVDLYLKIKIHNDENIDNSDEEQSETEKEILMKTDPLIIIERIENTIVSLIQLGLNEHFEAESLVNTSVQKENYEEQMQRLEEEARSHIAVCYILMSQLEEQLKLCIENMQDKIDTSERKLKETLSSIKVSQLLIIDSGKRVDEDQGSNR